MHWLPKCRFKGFQESDPVWVMLMNRTREALERDEVDAAGVAAMLGAIALLQHDLPQLRESLLPTLLRLAPDALPAMGPADLARLASAAAKLRDVAPDLWELLPQCLAGVSERADDLDDSQVVDLAAVLSNATSLTGASAALTVLRVQILRRLETMTLPQLADALWHLQLAARDGQHGEVASLAGELARVEEELMEALAALVTRQARYWNKRDKDPHLVRLVCFFAHLGRSANSDMLRAVARRAMRDSLPALSAWGVAALSWAYAKLETNGDGLGDFRRHLKQEAAGRGLTPEHIATSALGPDGGGDGALADFWASHTVPEEKRAPLLAPAPRLSALLSFASGRGRGSKPKLALAAGEARRALAGGAEDARGDD